MKEKWQWVCRDDDGWYVVCPLEQQARQERGHVGSKRPQRRTEAAGV